MKRIILSNNMSTIVDDEDFENLSRYNWGYVSGSKNKHIYAARGTRKNGKYSKILMHRELMGNPNRLMVDHINGDTLDNRKCNLRPVTRAENLQNSKLRNDSRCSYKGVQCRVSKAGLIRYNARIQISPNKRLYLGNFKTQEEAAHAYNDAATKYFGEHARLNVIK